jgi:hypothetical protein
MAQARLEARTTEGLKDANVLISRFEYSKIGLKRMFNRFADNIYYADPDRANVYLGK